MGNVIKMVDNDKIKEEYKLKLKEEAREIRDNLIKEFRGRSELTDIETFLVEQLEAEREKDKDDIEILRDSYYRIINIIDYYLDIKEEYQNILALWILGTYLHEEFDSYPFLFINAMRGSGKSRLLRLIVNLCKNARLTNSLTDAVIFRTKGMLAIDEFENVGSKEKQTLRELLNSAYKKGAKVPRMKEKKSEDGKIYVCEDFDVYRPVAMANIWGMDEVLGDRCITIILEKSSDPAKIKLVEDFEYNDLIKLVKNELKVCSLCSVVSVRKWYKMWNEYVKSKHSNIHYYITTHTTHTTETTIKALDTQSLLNQIDEFGVGGRNLEIFLPLLMISKIIGDDVLKTTLKTSSLMVYDKRHDEEVESKDVMLVDFISKLDESYQITSTSVRVLTNDFRNFADISDDEVNDKWFGRALKRLCLIIDKKRIRSGMVVTVNVAKAKNKMLMFRTGEQDAR